MNKGLLLFIIVLSACSQYAVVLNKTSSKVVGKCFSDAWGYGYCPSTVWDSCAKELCPNGYIVLQNQDGCGPDVGIIKCK